jgi:arylsulfatase A-like enzyme
VQAGWAVALLAEVVLVAVAWPAEFSGVWEVSLARSLVVPIAFVLLAPFSVLAAVLWELAANAGEGRRPAAAWLAGAGAVAGAAVGAGVSNGRHFASLGVRAAFVLGVMVAGAALGGLLVPRAARLARRPALLACLGVAMAAAFWWADARVLPRLYPAFHLATMAACLVGTALVAIAVREGSGGIPAAAARALPWSVVVCVAACGLRWPSAARELARLTNLRIALVERAPLLGPAVVAVTRLRAASVDEEGPAPATSAATVSPGEVPRTLDWTGHDLVLLTVDALRADHVSAYGYARPTTPNIDAIAGEGALFEAAYCPTPHTSYSVTSMMTGKYLRPLLALGLGADSETWAQDLRRYGWRTAAFYPPAVFFIDEGRFQSFEAGRLGFEYAKVEFADPALRERQVAAYLDEAPSAAPLFLWVHFFEPHEPYVAHPEHPFAGAAQGADVDAYDSEVAEADEGVGRVVRLVRARRPGAAIVVTADHGEEFGEHGGRYHGTTVYEEQVRVPLVVAGPGVKPGTRVDTVVQTIDLLPTVLSALGIPRPARVRGRDLGPVLAGDAREGGTPEGDGVAFAETDDYALVAAGADRLLCERSAAACALYRPGTDPAERHDLAAEAPARFAELRATLRAIERDHGRYEAAGGPPLPEALRRGMQGEVDAALDVASLLDDAEVLVRRKAAEVLYALRAVGTAPALRRALSREDDEDARRWIALALVRVGEPPTPLAVGLLRDTSQDWRRRSALALGERGDARACDEIGTWWADSAPSGGRAEDGEPPRLGMTLPDAQALLSATEKGRCRGAVPALLAALDDVRARPYVADTLGALGDERAPAPLLARLANEPYLTTRPHEARALLALGVHDWTATTPEAELHATLRAGPGKRRAVVLLSSGEVEDVAASPVEGGRVRVDLRAGEAGAVALWLVAGPDRPPTDAGD